MFDDVLEGFDGALIASRAVTMVNTDQTQMARTGDILWFPQPYIMVSYTGNDATASFLDVTQLSVPASINQQNFVPWVMSARDLRDAKQTGRLMEGAKKRLGFDMDVSCSNTAGAFGTVVIKRTVAASGYDDISLADAAFTEQGIPRNDRKALIGPRDYNLMAGNIAKPGTSANPLVNTAYERALIPNVAGFDVLKADYVPAGLAAAGTTVTITAGSGLFYTPVASTLTAGRGSLNVDNRFQTISIGVVGGTVKVGDSFTIAGVIALNHGSKTSTGQLKTFRVISIVTGGGGAGTIQIAPPIIPLTGGSGAPSELQYANVVAAPVAGALLTFLNTVAAPINPFWQDDAIQIMPGKLMPAPDSGMAVMSGSTDQGFTLLMTRQGEINQLQTKYRFDAIWGVNAMQPEMMGIILFGQS